METKKPSQGLCHIVAKSGKNGEQTWLPLWMHATDTAGTMKWLIREWIPESVIDLFRESINVERASKADVETLGVFCGYIHDFGKNNSYFQCLSTKTIPEAKARMKDDGTSILSWNQYKKEGCNHAYIGEALLRKYECEKGVASIIGSHHGMTQEIDKRKIKTLFSSNSSLRKNLYGDNEKQWKSLRSEFLEWALMKSGYSDINKVPEISEKGQILMTGLLIMADWISSNETYFPLLPLSEEGDESYYPKRITDAIKKIDLLKPWVSKISHIDESVFKNYFGFKPRSTQLDFIQTIENLIDKKTNEPGIFILEAPMGSGKTEAALAGAQLLANKKLAGGVFFGLPTQATTNAIFKRLTSWAKKMAADDNLRHSIRLAHSLSNFEPQYQKMLLGDSQFDDDDETRESRLYVHTWFNGKKQALLADFVIGTIDQILMSALKKKHVMLRHLGMAGKIVIVDECHAYDVYTSEYLDRTLTWLGTYGQPVIILSATLPAHRRRKLVAAYLNEDIERIPEELEYNKGYPFLTYSVGRKVQWKTLQFDGNQLLIKLEDLQEEKLIEFLESELKDGGCAAIILNTVKHVQQIAQLLRKCLPEKDILELHSRYIYPDRKDKEDELMRRMGKESTKKERDGFILVASQVAEQSLDFDADILITELCPIDLLFQRMGREHRHLEHNSMRPSNLSKPRCMILREGDEAYSKGSKAVYAEYLLMRTQAILPQLICIPKEIPQLVQKVYTENDELFKNIVGYSKAKDDYQIEQQKKRARAEAFLLQRPEIENDGEFTLDSFLQNSTQVNDKVAEASVRDGGSSLEVLVLQKREGKIAFLPWQDENEILDGSEVPLQEIGMKIARQRLRLPRSFCTEDRLPRAINELDSLMKENFEEWKKSPWINGELILLLDENLSATLADVQLQYSKEDGLIEIKEQEEIDGRDRI